jgi:hypothetical protein
MVVISRDFEDGVVSAIVDGVSFVSNNIPRGFRSSWYENTVRHTRSQKTKVKSKDSTLFLIDFVPVSHNVARVPRLSCTWNIKYLL